MVTMNFDAFQKTFQTLVSSRKRACDEKAKDESISHNEQVMFQLCGSVYTLMLSVIRSTPKCYPDPNDAVEHYRVFMTTLSSKWRQEREQAIAVRDHATLLELTVKTEALHEVERFFELAKSKA